jgi:hypothetical protein
MYLHPSSTFAIGLLEIIAWALAFYLLYRIVASFASNWTTIGMALLSFAFVARFAEGGNLCESWALLPLAAAHYAAWRWSNDMALKWCGAVLGISFAALFWIRPNMAAYPTIAIIILLICAGKNLGLREASRYGLGIGGAALGLTVLVLAPIYLLGAFPDFISAYFGYNAAYSGALSPSARLYHTQDLLITLFATGIAVLGLGGWSLSITKREQKSTQAGLPLSYLQTVAWSTPLEFLASLLSGRDYPHYVLQLFPTMAVLAGWFLSRMEGPATAPLRRRSLVPALLIGFCPFALLQYARDFSESSAGPNSDYVQIIRFIQSVTSPSDRIMVIGGAEAGYISYRAQRLPASRYVYQYPLIDWANPRGREQRQEFVRDLVLSRPPVIVSGNPLVGLLCATQVECSIRNGHLPLTDYGYDSAILPELLRILIASDYRNYDSPRFNGIHVFVRRDVQIPADW